MKELNVFVSNNDYSYLNFIKNYKVNKVPVLEKADLVIFTGGADVHPIFYSKEKPVDTISHDLKRDEREVLIYNNALQMKIPMLGICRGAQFLTVMNGGKLIQDVYPQSSGQKKIITTLNEGYKKLVVHSDHHQEMYPINLKDKDYKILGFSFYSPIHKALYYKKNINMQDFFYDITLENVFYPTTQCLCVQTHPEWLSTTRPGEVESLDYFNTLLESLMLESDFIYNLPELTYSNLEKWIKDNIKKDTEKKGSQNFEFKYMFGTKSRSSLEELKKNYYENHIKVKSIDNELE